jgi:hypothetical protein
MLHFTTPDKSRILKYSFTPLGNLIIQSLNPKADATKSFLTEGSGLGSQIVQVEYKAKEYQTMLASVFVESQMPQNTININYVSYPKSAQKPDKFEVESQRITSFTN